MRSDQFSFGSLTIDGKEYDYDLVIDRGHVAKRKKKASKKYRHEFGHTPLSLEENIPWKCSQLVIGTGAYGRLPVMDEVRAEAKRRKIDLVLVATSEAIELIKKTRKKTNAILHVTC